MNDPGYPDTLDGWLTLLERRHPKAIDLGLERCRAVWDRMGRPLPGKRMVVIAGTNGKGSVVATLCSLLDAQGLSHGSYTSPHLLRFNERVRIGGREAGDEAWLSAFESVEAALGGTSLSYFEFTTLAAFRLMARHELDYAVMEVGLGGRLDAVNLLDADCAVITSLGLDHQEYLGGDLESIGREKAGVMRRGKPVVCSEPRPPSSVLDTARERDADLLLRGRDFDAQAGADGLRFRMADVDLVLSLPELAGEHQVINTAAALAALIRLEPEAAERPERLERGLAGVRLRGRLERVVEQPPVWVDVGHNPLAARAIAATLRDLMSRAQTRRCRCVLGMLSDKDAAGVAEALGPIVDLWYCGTLVGARAQEGRKLAARIENATPGARTRAFESVPEALEAAMADSSPRDGVLVFGSFFTAAEAIQALVASGAAALPGSN